MAFQIARGEMRGSVQGLGRAGLCPFTLQNLHKHSVNPPLTRDCGAPSQLEKPSQTVFVSMPTSCCCCQDHGYLEQGLGLLLVWKLHSVVAKWQDKHLSPFPTTKLPQLATPNHCEQFSAQPMHRSP